MANDCLWLDDDDVRLLLQNNILPSGLVMSIKSLVLDR